MGGGGGPSGFLPAPSPKISWIQCGHSKNFLEISVIVPLSDQKRFSPWANAKFTYMAWENSGQYKGLFQAQNRKITMTSSEN